MARYTKTFLDLDNPNRKINLDFIGWDGVAQGQPSVEGRTAAQCYVPMNARDVARFEALSPGTARTHDGAEYFREW